MQILDNLFHPHADRLQRALGRTAERQGLLLNNLANVNTPGFRRRDMDFAVALDEAKAESGPSRMQRWRDRAGESIGRGEGQAVRVDGNGVDLEQEVLSIAEMDLRYQTLTDLTSRYFSGLRNVIREGR